MPTRLAAIDIGTNSVRSVIVEVSPSGAHKTLDDEKAYTRLGRGLATTGLMSERAMDETVEALRRMREIAATFRVSKTRAIGTAAMRTARNSDVLRERLLRELDLEVEIISQEEEGRLAFLSAASAFAIEGRAAVIDIGGGSLEVVRSTGRQIETIASMPLGTVVLSERYHATDPIPRAEFKRLVRHVRRTLEEHLGASPDPVSMLVGSGGTIAAIAAIVAAQRRATYTTLHGAELSRADVAHTLARLARSSAEERRNIKGMPESRVDIIVAGAVVVDEVMRALGANTLLLNTKGVREGLVIDMIERERGTRAPLDRLQAAEEFASRCGYDERHAHQVRDLALALFDALEGAFDLDPQTRPLLEAAAVLHDVGYHIAYEQHHKHSYHLISYSDLPGFSSRELGLVAAIARYHRGALPKAKHEAVAHLDEQDRRVVERLGGIVRLADGLDRTRSQRLEGISVGVTRNRVTVSLLGDGDLSVEAHGAANKGDLFERAFGVELEIRTASSAPSEGEAHAAFD